MVDWIVKRYANNLHIILIITPRTFARSTPTNDIFFKNTHTPKQTKRNETNRSKSTNYSVQDSASSGALIVAAFMAS